MAYTIRDFAASDAPALAELTLAAIHDVGLARYNEAQTQAWAARHHDPERFLKRVAKGARIWVAVTENDEPAAYALLETEWEPSGSASGHLDMLYCHPDHTRKGLADMLLSHAESSARSDQLTRLFTEASDLARPAFERAGYTVQHRRDFTIEHEGCAVPIQNYAMEKRLT
ncbi:MAG: GNAT family N-acetyltransferase [Pseudomonadota bacterium]